MKRRDFFEKGVKSALGAGLISIVGQFDNGKSNERDSFSEKKSIASKAKRLSSSAKRKKEVNYDVAVIGGGLAGICAAVSASRNGAHVVLVQDRPVLGGNSSSEIRVHVNGASYLRPDRLPERETGIIEELLLANRFNNPQQAFPVWDHVLYDFVREENGLDLMLNTQAIEAIVNDDKIRSAKCWQLTTETEYMINAGLFIDCSGDGMLAASAGAEFRTGREASSEFDEKYAPKEADGWQMGSSILWHAEDMGKPMPFTPPSWAIKYDAEKAFKRKIRPFFGGIWWCEIGSEDDIIEVQEVIRDKLMAHLYGIWDYIKNSGEFPEAENMALTWVGSLQGRRESRRFMGDHILSEKDLTEHRHFEDAVAFGGWSIDEHGEGGIENLKVPGSYFHHHFHEVYQIPFRSLYSRNISNLLFAGRNVSQTHIALSSSRVMGTCATMGQAVGTAAAIGIKKGALPRQIAKDHMDELQEQLLRDDAFIPKRPAKDEDNLLKKAAEIYASSTSSGDVMLLLDGTARDIYGEIHHWQSDSLDSYIQAEWLRPIYLSKVEIKCDTNLKKNILMHKQKLENVNHTNEIPPELLKSLNVKARINGKWKRIATLDNNKKRLIKFSFEKVSTTAIRIQLNQTYGKNKVKLFELRCY